MRGKLNNSSELQLSEIFKRYGEEPSCELLARLIVRERETKPFVIAEDLKNIIINRLSTSRDSKSKIVSRVFQALRIAINHEFMNIQELMDAVAENLAHGGIGVFITFHSLEEKIVSRNIRERVDDEFLADLIVI